MKKLLIILLLSAGKLSAQDNRIIFQRGDSVCVMTNGKTHKLKSDTTFKGITVKKNGKITTPDTTVFFKKDRVARIQNNKIIYKPKR